MVFSVEDINCPINTVQPLFCSCGSIFRGRTPLKHLRGRTPFKHLRDPMFAVAAFFYYNYTIREIKSNRTREKKPFYNKQSSQVMGKKGHKAVKMRDKPYENEGKNQRHIKIDFKTYHYLYRLLYIFFVGLNVKSGPSKLISKTQIAFFLIKCVCDNK